MKKIYLLFSLFISINLVAQVPEALISKVSPAIFKVTAYDASNTELQSGTGFFINSSGTALTNYHLMAGASKVKVHTTDGKVYLVNMILSQSKDNDLIKFSVKNELSEVFQSLKVNPNSPKAGESVFILTNDGGQDVTYKQRSVSSTGTDKTFGETISLNSSFSTGFSGAPLMNMNGEVYGIVTDLAADGNNISFCSSVKNMNEMEDVNALKFPAKDDNSVPDVNTGNDDTDPHNTMYYLGSKVVFCDDVDSDNNPKNPGSTFPVGKVTIYVDNGSKKLSCSQLSVKYYLKGSSDDKETLADEGTIPVSDGLTALWYDHTFKEAGEYRISVYNDLGAWVNDANVTITSGSDYSTNDPKSTMYYLDSKITFCEKLDDNSNFVGEGTRFNRGTVTIYLSNGGTKNLSTTLLKVKYYKKINGDYSQVDTENISITGKYPAAYFTHDFTDKGEYRVSIDNEFDVWINSSELTVK